MRSWRVLLVMLVLAGCDETVDTRGDGGSDDLGDVGAELAADAVDQTDDAAADSAGLDAVDTEADATEWPEQDQRGEEPMALSPIMPPAGDGALKVLVANVGNFDFTLCTEVAFKLCRSASEQVIAARIAELRPDVVLLQEVLPPELCELDVAWNRRHVCHPDHAFAEPNQVRRLLGPEFTIACEPRNGYECVAVRQGIGSIEGCADGALCREIGRSVAAPDGCDGGFTVSAFTLHLGERLLDVVDAHPPSGPDNGACRAAFLAPALDPGDADTIIARADVLLGGDLNMDPYREPADRADVALFWQWSGLDVGDATKRFALHSGAVEHNPPYWTSVASLTFDHVASNALRGRCVTLGAAPGEAPLDLGTGTIVEELDHLAQWCALEWRTP